jgi:hypothetical protein
MTFEFFFEIDRPCILEVLVRVVEAALPFLAPLENTVRPKLQPPDGLRSLNSISARVCFTARRENCA